MALSSFLGNTCMFYGFEASGRQILVLLLVFLPGLLALVLKRGGSSSL